MSKYDFTAIEAKWQRYWAEHDTFHAEDDYTKPKFYALVEFPYPSGQGLHIGHPRPYTAMDVVSRKRRMEGYNVLFPMGWDAFGLPTENYAIKHKIHPAIVTANNVARFKSQLQALGMSFDWDREINTTDPNYFHWTQWIFLQMFKKGLAYKKETAVNWCTSCKVVLANEEVVGGVCERCGGEVVQKVKSQWMLKITEYAQRLLDDLDEVDYLEKIKTAQRNWIGRSTGAEVDFQTTAGDTLKIYTTRPDTLFGATYMVISPEHPLIEKWADKLENMDEIRAYQEKAARKSDFERTEMAKEKTGVCLKGVRGINPVNDKEIPIFVSDYVLMSYGTGAIMAVPAHDTRDYEFAKKFGIDIIEVIKGGDISKEAYTGDGEMVNSGELNGITNKKDAIEKMLGVLAKLGCGEKGVQYKMKDWAFNRQRYWGEPIPIVHCPDCGIVPVPYEELPLELPPVENFQPGQDGESPLAKIDSFVHCKCPKCGKDARRETDTMPQWAGSSWYFLRYCDPNNDKEFASQEALKYWLPVDWYNGGMEHVTRHMIYSRFWHKFLYDIGEVPTPEPYAKRTAQGLILGPDGEKMSKSRGNVIDPNDVVDVYGADVLRVYVLFMGDYEQAAPWNDSSMKGCKRFLDRVWNLQNMLVRGDEYSDELRTSMHKTIKKVSEDIEKMRFNTAIAAMMSLINEITANGKINDAEMKSLLILLNPFAPHITEEMYNSLGYGILNEAQWVTYDEALCVDSTVEIVVQLCGKIKARINVPTAADKDELLKMAKEAIAQSLEGKTIRKEIVVPGKLVNIVAN